MSREERVILANMCMVSDDDKILVMARKSDDWPGICFPGGHIEPNESFVASTVREVYEETGLVVSDLKLCGHQQFTMPEGYRYIVFLYKTDTFSGQLKSSEEGDVFWVKRSELEQYQLADGFDVMLSIFEDEALSENYYYIENDNWEWKNL
ncbi:8-oxo-dGTP diphosphatase [Streptococcus sp. S784/96/1]|uniref:8-oxo-dGTP diphosphatase n=1 Tax=Streptococcus sp. S784/96/1 TaxID=2653499 RepID=UPI001386F192|nr:8-oxo-dGTP diphosphatase [Streptococcus sp. S784/96/1]